MKNDDMNHLVFESRFYPGHYPLLSMCGTYGGGAPITAALKVQEAGPFDPGWYAVVSFPDTLKLDGVYEDDGRGGYRVPDEVRHLVKFSKFRLRRNFN